MYAPNMTDDQFDKAYLTDMIAHHQGALNMGAFKARELSTKLKSDAIFFLLRLPRYSK